MGRTNRLVDAFGFLRRLLEGKQEPSHTTAPFLFDSVEKTVSMWPEASLGKNHSDAVFMHLRRLYRYGFRLSIQGNDLRLRQFFADGETYRPEGHLHDSDSLIADLAHLANEKNVLRVGQCRIARAKPVLRALGFAEFDSPESYAIQFAGIGAERWIFIDTRPEVFRREAAEAVAKSIEKTAKSIEKAAKDNPRQPVSL